MGRAGTRATVDAPHPRRPRRGEQEGHPWHRNPKLGLGLIIGACVAEILVAFAGPSAVTLQLGPRDGSLLPPWYLPTQYFFIDDWTATTVLWAVVAIGAFGLVLCLRALAAGWRPRVARLIPVGVGLNVLTALVPPVTSADILMYAAYGRIQVLGMNPYQITPADIFRLQYDPVLRWTERPWQDTPSVYGPLASLSQWMANVLGGQNMHDIVFWLQVFHVLPLIGIGIVCLGLTRNDARAQGRALLLVLLNPVLIWSVVAGGHNEALGVVFAIAAMTMMRRNPFLVGIGIGLAGCVKVSLIFYGIGMAWAYRRKPRALLLLLAGAALPLGLCYGILAPQALFAAWRNTGYISTGSWASPWWGWLYAMLGSEVARRLLSGVSIALFALVAWILYRVLPWRAVPGLRATDPRGDPLTVALRATLVLCTSWLITSTYTMAWYDLIVWAPIAVLGASLLDYVLIWRATWLSLAFVTGRALQFTEPVKNVGVFLQSIACPAAQYLVLATVVWWGVRDWRRRRRLRQVAQERWIGDGPAPGPDDVNAPAIS